MGLGVDRDLTVSCQGRRRSRYYSILDGWCRCYLLAILWPSSRRIHD